MDRQTRTTQALRSLEDVLRSTIDDLEALADRAHALCEEIAGDVSLSDAMAAEERPLIITRLVDLTDRLHEAGGTLRRAEARQLRDEGRTHEEIAEIFGVTRQRVGALLAAPQVRPATKRPRRQ